MKIAIIEKNEQTIKVFDIAYTHIVCAIIHKCPCMLSRSYGDEYKWLIMGNFGENAPTSGIFFSIKTPVQENINLFIRESIITLKADVAVFEPHEYIEALQWLVDNCKTGQK